MTVCGMALDVEVGDWQMPWNAEPDAVRLTTGVPPPHLEAPDHNGFDHVGSYTPAMDLRGSSTS